MRCRSIHRVVALALALVSVTGCSDGSGGSDRSEPSGPRGGLVAVHRYPAAEATALAVLPDRTVLVGERETGRLLRIDPWKGAIHEVGRVGSLDPGPGQRGLLGLAVADDGTISAALTTTDGRIEVMSGTRPGSLTPRWRGPRSTDEANGGRLVTLPDGGVAIGIGDLLDPDRTPDPDAPNGKVLRIDGPGVTTPLAGGLNNPFALAAGPDGTVWVADNAPGRRPERLLRFPAEPEPEPEDGAGSARVPEPTVVAEWTDTRVPSGVAWLTDGRLALCSYATSELRVVAADDVDQLADPDTGTLVADDCRYGVVALADGGLAYAADDAVVLLRPA